MNKLQEPQEFSYKAIKDVFKINKLSFIGIFISIILIFLVYSFVAPHKYETSFTLLPSMESNSGMGLSNLLKDMPIGGGIAGSALGGSDPNLNMFFEVLRSRTVADYVFKNTKLSDTNYFKFKYKEEYYQFYNNIKLIEKSRNDVLRMTVTLNTDFMPDEKEQTFYKELVSNIANQAINGMDSLLRNKNTSSARLSKEYVAEEIKRYHIELDSIQREIEFFQTENNVLELESQTSALLTQAIDLGSQLAIAELELNLAKREYSPNSPQFKSIEETYKTLKDQYEKVQQGGLTSSDAFSIPLKNVPTLIREYTDLIRKQKVIEQVIMYLETQRHQEAIAEKKDLPVVEVLDYPYVPDKKSTPQKKIILIFGAFVSLLITVLFLLIYAFNSKSVYVKKIEKETSTE